jgi:hypothetical protein
MEQYYRNHHISARAELDRESNLYRTVVVIKPVIYGDLLATRFRSPENGIFRTDGAAELYGMVLARDWIGRITAGNF